MELYAKAMYFLNVLTIIPSRAFLWENALFDYEGFGDVESERCDRVCHLVIDILAYFSSRTF